MYTCVGKIEYLFVDVESESTGQNCGKRNALSLRGAGDQDMRDERLGAMCFFVSRFFAIDSSLPTRCVSDRILVRRLRMRFA